ncbi:unknown [Bacteroides sp. CAG:545]|nr:unknown [Bacteroides sp. CAG:545]
MVASRTASHRKKLNIHADSPKIVKPSSIIDRGELRGSHG